MVEKFIQVGTLLCHYIVTSLCTTSSSFYSQLFGEEDQLGEDSVSPDTADPEAAG